MPNSPPPPLRLEHPIAFSNVWALTSHFDRGRPAQDEAGGPPSCSPVKWRWGLEAHDTRLVAATIPTVLTLIRSREGALKRREAATSTTTPSSPYCTTRRCLCAVSVAERGRAGIVDDNDSERYVSQKTRRSTPRGPKVSNTGEGSKYHAYSWLIWKEVYLVI